MLRSEGTFAPLMQVDLHEFHTRQDPIQIRSGLIDHRNDISRARPIMPVLALGI